MMMMMTMMMMMIVRCAGDMHSNTQRGMLHLKRIRLAILLSHCTMTLGQPVLSLTLKHKMGCRAVIRILILKSLARNQTDSACNDELRHNVFTKRKTQRSTNAEECVKSWSRLTNNLFDNSMCTYSLARKSYEQRKAFTHTIVRRI